MFFFEARTLDFFLPLKEIVDIDAGTEVMKKSEMYYSEIEMIAVLWEVTESEEYILYVNIFWITESRMACSCDVVILLRVTRSWSMFCR